MSLLEEARTESARLPGPLCQVAKAMTAHPTLADDIANVIRDRDIANAAAARTFERHGIQITGTTISRHRSNNCATCKAQAVIW